MQPHSHSLSLSTLDSQMVWVEGGVFEMGGESFLGGGEPVHRVKLDDFELCRYPVSQHLWREVMGSDPQKIKFQNPHRPVEGVSWEDIQDDFLPALRAKTGDDAYCLPTEAQWEYAARGGKYRQAHVGLPEAKEGDFFYSGGEWLAEVGWYKENAFEETQVLGCKRPNALGLYEMSGNVYEWCQDRYGGDYYKELSDQYGDEPVVNPSGPAKGQSRVVRGGSWLIDHYLARVSDRYSYLPDFRFFGGFRLCRYLR